jgi:hypothetical protein
MLPNHLCDGLEGKRRPTLTKAQQDSGFKCYLQLKNLKTPFLTLINRPEF